MKKNLVLSAAVLGAASFMMLSGFDSAETAESVLAKYEEASAALTTATANVEAVADLAIEIPAAETSFDIQGQGTMDVAVNLDPISAVVSGSFSGSALGEGGSMDMATYMVSEDDGSISVYAGTDGEWVKTVLDAETAQQIRDAIANSAALDQSDIPLTYTLDSEPADVNGTECYKLSANLTWDDMKELINWSISKTSELGLDTEEEGVDLESATAELQTYLDLADAYVSGLQLNIDLYVDTETFYPTLVHMDLDDTDWSSIAIIAASAMGLEDEDGTLMDLNINVNSLYMDYYYDVTSDVVIEVPEDVIASAVEASAEDLAADLTSVVEEETEF